MKIRSLATILSLVIFASFAHAGPKEDFLAAKSGRVNQVQQNNLEAKIQQLFQSQNLNKSDFSIADGGIQAGGSYTNNRSTSVVTASYKLFFASNSLKACKLSVVDFQGTEGFDQKYPDLIECYNR